MSDVYNNTITQYLGSGEVDSLGNPLPANFTSREATHTYAWSGGFPSTKTSVIVVAGVGTYTRITTFTNDGTNITAKVLGAWVKS